MASKSKTVKQLARKRGVKFVDVPLSMMDTRDMRGLPVLPQEAQAFADAMVRDRQIGEHKLGGK